MADTQPPLTPEQQARERSMILVIVLDAGILTALFLSGILGGSLTIIAEFLRGGLGYLLECFSLLLLRRIHRGKLAEMDYGAGKLEQVANLLVGTSMLMASAWILVGVVKIVTGARQLATPFGLACAAMLEMVNVYVNVIAWDSVRRSAGTDSLIMQTQVQLRWVKLCASVVVVTGLTIAALSTDDMIVACADGAGSLFVACYLAASSRTVLRLAVSDLLDRSAGADVRLDIDRALARHAGDYARVIRKRSRRSGQVVFIEIALAFDAALPMAEVNRRIESLKRTIKESRPDAEVSILASAWAASVVVSRPAPLAIG